MANRFFLGFLLLLLLAFLTWGGIWFMQNFERIEEEIRSGYSAEARRNPLLAAERFLQRLDRQAVSLSGRDRLKQSPIEPGLLLVKDLGPSLSSPQEQELLAWVAEGNHLIASLASIPGEDEANNHLLETLGVRLEALYLEQEEEEEEDNPVELNLPGADEAIQIDFEPDRVMDYEGEDFLWQVSTEQGFHLLSFAWGSGVITLLSDSHFLTNGQIEQWDHALLLDHLTQDAPKIWLLYSSQMPSLLVLAWRFSPELMLSACLLLLLCSWWMTYRSGPTLMQGSLPRRNLLEHLEAAAEFLWQQDRAASLLEGSRRQLLQSWTVSHPLLERMDQDARCHWLAERTGLSSRAIHQALEGEFQPHERSLIETSLTQQRLFAALLPDKRIK